MSRWVVVLAGGVGSRFWPLSTPQRPKQLLALVGKKPMLVEQLNRLSSIAPPSRTLILTNASLVRAIGRAAPRVPRKNIIAEPRPAGTAAALAWAAHLIQKRDGPAATMVSVHADWAIGDTDAFRTALTAAADAAEAHDGLVTVGVVPNRVETGLGYTRPGQEVAPGVWRVAEFVEKPPVERARHLVQSGALWNSGIFVWRVGVFLSELQAHAPEVAPALAKHGSSLKKFFGAVKHPIAVDHAVLERSSKVLVMRGSFGWDDVGTWEALHRVRAHDPEGNAALGAVHAYQAANNVVHAEGNRVVLYGVENLVVVSVGDLTLVTTREKSVDLKKLVESLPASVRTG